LYSIVDWVEIAGLRSAAAKEQIKRIQ
jgi:hypothetical protein